MKLVELSTERQRDIFNNVGLQAGLPPISIEKDWWVTQVLQALFALPYANYLSFKGGTSLSKCWKLIERFSEDIDVSIDRYYLGFTGELTKTQISDKLRRMSCQFVRVQLLSDLQERLAVQGLADNLCDVSVDVTPITTTDPETIFVRYKSVFGELQNQYLPPVVKIEVGGRSMTEPTKMVDTCSIVDETYPGSVFAEKSFAVRAVLPERTFLEKMFLLQEELSRPNIRIDRMSRHIYDVAMLMSREIHSKALSNMALYGQVVEHRRKFIGLKGFDYDLLYPNAINIILNEEVTPLWKSDYQVMREQMIWGDAPDFDYLIERMKELNEMVRKLHLG